MVYQSCYTVLGHPVLDYIITYYVVLYYSILFSTMLNCVSSFCRDRKVSAFLSRFPVGELHGLCVFTFLFAGYFVSPQSGVLTP